MKSWLVKIVMLPKYFGCKVIALQRCTKVAITRSRAAEYYFGLD